MKKWLLNDDDLSTFCSDMEDSPFFSSDEDEPSKKKQFRNIAAGVTLNNSFRCMTADNWDHLHVDKGPNTQFNIPTNTPNMKLTKTSSHTGRPHTAYGGKQKGKNIMRNNFM